MVGVYTSFNQPDRISRREVTEKTAVDKPIVFPVGRLMYCATIRLKFDIYITTCDEQSELFDLIAIA